MTWFGHRDLWTWLQRMSAPRLREGRDPSRPIRVVGHRGAPRLFPENTVASYSAAIELGADALEVDICLTRDERVVLWHDNEPGDPVSLARGIGAEEFAFSCDWPSLASDDRQPVYEMTLDEMRERCGYSPAGLTLSDPRPPITFELLEDLFRWANREPRLAEICFDVKLRPEHAERAPLILDAIAALKPRDGLELSLLLPQRELWDVLARAPLPPRTRLVPDFELPNILEECRELDSRNVSMGYSMKRLWGDFTRELAHVLAARDAGAIDRVIVWTFNDPKRLRALVEAGVDAILTDDAELLRGLVNARHARRT